MVGGQLCKTSVFLARILGYRHNIFTDDMLLGINDNKYVLSIFVDLRKAFDSVNHNILISKLE